MKKVFLLFVFVCGLFASGKDSKSKNSENGRDKTKISLDASGTPADVSADMISEAANNIGHRQGGDTFASATVIEALPFSDSGTTSGFNNDYGPYSNHSSYNICQWQGYYDNTNTGAGPDVVYSLALSEEKTVKISLCGSDYDTGLGVFDGSGVQVLGNDDACSLQSEVVCALPEGLYYIVVDGYSTSSGNYVLNVSIEEDLFGPYSVGTITEDDGLRDGPDYCCGILYYPTDAVGYLPAIVYIPGWAGTISSNENWGPYLASHGIVTMFVNANIWTASNETRAEALLDGLVTFEDENQRPGSPLYGNLNLNQLAVAGHSRGGGAALLAAAAEPSVNAVLALAPWLEDQFINSTTLDQDVPVLFLSGQLDESAPNDIHTNLFYAYTPETTDKLLYEISGGDHFIVKDPSNNSAMAMKALYWLEKYLTNDPTHCDLLIEEPTTASQFMTNVECGGGILPPVIALIDDQQISEDGILTIGLSATPGTGTELSFSVVSSTPDVIVSLDNTTLTATPVENWHGSVSLTVFVTDENNLSDDTEFSLTVTPVNDPPLAFTTIYPTASDTFSTHIDNNTLIPFVWRQSDDIDSDVTYTLTIELELTDETYNNMFEDIGDTTVSISANSLDEILQENSLNEAEFTYYVHASDGEFNVASDIGEFVVKRETAEVFAPVISSIDDQLIDEDGELMVTVSATSATGLSMTYHAYSDTSAVSTLIDAQNLNVAAEQNWSGSSTITVFATDENYLSDTTSFMLTVSPVNDAPTISAIDDITIMEDSTSSIIINAQDVDGDDLEYDYLFNTQAEPYFDVVLEGETVTISPHLNWFGEASLTISASDGQVGVDTGFSITVSPVNDAPTIEEIDDVSIDEDGSIDIVLSSEDVDGDDLTYSFHLDNYDLSLGIDEDTLRITATPDFNGDVPITMFVSDTELMDSTSFTVTVNAVNDPPSEFGLIFPTVVDTIEVNTATDETIPFTWEPSFDPDSDVTYRLTVTLDYFGNVYTNEYENITDTTTGISAYEYAVLMTNLSLSRWNMEYVVDASDEEFTIASEEGAFVLENTSLSIGTGALPEAFALHQNYPNPFNPVTSLRYDLPEDGLVNITVYDMIGRIVKNLVNSPQTAGYKSIIWDATNNRNEPISAGLYLYTIHAGKFRDTRKMVLLK
mgnify:CR=1 FL=1